jgi:hypothetical protein
MIWAAKQRLIVTLRLCGAALLPAQSHKALSLGGFDAADGAVYRILEQASLRGLCGPLSVVKPWPRSYALTVIGEVLAGSAARPNAALSAAERRILEDARTRYGAAPAAGLDLRRLAYRFGSDEGFRSSGEVDVQVDVLGSAAYRDDLAFATDNWFTVAVAGDMGERFSYSVALGLGILRNPRQFLGVNTVSGDPNDIFDETRKFNVYSLPQAFFPYGFKKHWDSFTLPLSDLSTSGMRPWPDTDISAGFSMQGEMAGSLLEDHFFWRFGRVDREWGGMAEGSSLVLNQNATPFAALEAAFRPFPWLSLSTLTGILEYSIDDRGLKASAATSQNAFSVSRLGVEHPYFHVD